MTERPGGQRTVDDVGAHPAERDAGEAGRPWLGRVTTALRAAAHRPAVPEQHVMTVGELASARGLPAAAAHGPGVDLVKRARVTTASDLGLPGSGPACDRRAPDRPATDPAAAESASLGQLSAEPEASGSRSARPGADRLPTPVSRTASAPAPVHASQAEPALDNPADPLPGAGDAADRRAPDEPAAGAAPVRQPSAEPEAVRPGGDRPPLSASGTATTRRPDPEADGVAPADRGGRPVPVNRVFPADRVQPRRPDGPPPFQRPAGPRPLNRFSVPARPRVDDEYAILGLTRRSRGRVGSRLFTLFFVFIYGVIVLQLIAVLLGPSP